MGVRAAALGLALVMGCAHPGLAAPDYAGKTVTVLVGYAAGGGYSAYAQLIAKFFGRHLPGAPSVVVQHMPGAGSLVAANFITNVAKPDGLTIGAINMFNLYTNYMFKADGVHYDLAKMNFVGNVRSGNSMLLVRRDAYPTLEAVKAAQKPIHLGIAVKGDGDHIFALLMSAGLKKPFEFVIGYGGGGGMDLALEKGEIDARVANLNSYLISKPAWIKDGFLAVLAQRGVIQKDGGYRRDPRLPDTPTVKELFPDDDEVRQLMAFNSVSDLLSGVYIAPPNTPADLLAALRQGFMDMLRDPDFRADAQKFDLEITPMDSGEVKDIVNRALDLSPRTVEFVKDLSH